jgi:hypothetical protein
LGADSLPLVAKTVPDSVHEKWGQVEQRYKPS